MKLLKKTLAILMCLIMVISIIPISTVSSVAAGSKVYVNNWEKLKNYLSSDETLEIVLEHDIKYENPPGGILYSKFLEVNGTKTLDLNGKKIEVIDHSDVDEDKDDGSDSESYIFNIDGNLTVNDSVGSGSIRNDAHYISPDVFLFDHASYHHSIRRNIFWLSGDAKLIVNGGTFIAGGAKEQYLSDEVCYAHIIAGGTPITVFDSDSSAVINGGTFIAHSSDLAYEDKDYGNYTGYSINAYGSVDIYGGTFIMNGEGEHIFSGSGDNFNIYSGTFLSTTYDKIRRWPDDYMQGNNKATKGGMVGYGILDKHWKREGTIATVNGEVVDKSLSQYLNNYKDGGVVSIASKSFGGGVCYISASTVGKPVSISLSGELKDIATANPSKVKYQWQLCELAGYRDWQDIPGATYSTYTPTADDYSKFYGRTDLRVVITVDGYANRAVTPPTRINKNVRYEVPNKAYATANPSKKTATITGFTTFKDQEFVLSESSSPNWKNDMHPDANGVFSNLEVGKTYYLHTRFAETEYQYAGKTSVSSQITISETVYLKDIEIVAEKTTGMAGQYIKISVKPIPANATNFNGISKWYINNGLGSKADLYANTSGTKITSGTSYKTVYLKGTEAETVKVSGEYSFGYNDIRILNTTIDLSDSQGKYNFTASEISYDPSSSITVERGSVARVTLYSYISPSKPIANIAFNRESGAILSGVTITHIKGTNDVEIKATDTATIGKGYYVVYVNGIKLNGTMSINVTDSNVPADSISLSSAGVVLKVGGTHNLVANVSPSNVTDKVIWSSSNTAVATVSNGKITAVKEGKAVITAKVGDVVAKCNVTVSNEAEMHSVDVTCGTSSAETAAQGTVVTVTADAAPAGMVFDKWMSSSVTVAEASSITTTFVMPSKDVSLTATYKQKGCTDHSYSGDNDETCDLCDYNRADNCDCNCHAGGLKAFFFKLGNFFAKLFNPAKRVCACGMKH